jgi:DHA2 family multidrug resistance protein
MATETATELAPSLVRTYPTGLTRVILVGTAISCALLELIDTTVVNVALNEMSGSLGATTTEIAWVVTSYGIANVIVIPLSAMFSALFGRKRYFTGSVVVFTIASLMCGLSGSLWTLVFWRLIQGLGGGGLLSTAQSIIFDAFPPKEAAVGTAIFGLGVILGPTFGPVMGGYITDTLSWHWIFFVNLPVGALAAVLAWNFVPDLLGASKPDRLDWWGIGLLVVGIGSLQYVLEEGGTEDWFESTEITVFFITAVVMLTGFIWRELSINYPAVNLRLYRSYNLALGNLLNLIVGTVITGSVFIFPLFVQTSLGWTGTQTGAFMIPGALCTAAGMIIVARLLGSGVNPKVIMSLGAVMMSAFLVLLSFSSPESGRDEFFWPFILRGVGAAFMMSPVMGLSVAGLTGRDLAQAAGLSNMLRQLGGAVGIAFINLFLNTRTGQARNGLLSNITEFSDYATERVAGFTQTLVDAGYATDDAAAGAWRLLGSTVAKQQAIVAYNQGFFMMGLAVLACLPIIAFIRYKKGTIIQAGGDH